MDEALIKRIGEMLQGDKEMVTLALLLARKTIETWGDYEKLANHVRNTGDIRMWIKDSRAIPKEPGGSINRLGKLKFKEDQLGTYDIRGIFRQTR